MDYNSVADNSSIEYYHRPNTYQPPTPAYYPPFEEQEQNRIYSFMPLESVFQQKRPRRKFNEIERLYQCNFYNCTKSYGTLNHLNAHISMQEHGPKRLPIEFKELRKQLRKTKAQLNARNRNSVISSSSTELDPTLLTAQYPSAVEHNRAIPQRQIQHNTAHCPPPTQQQQITPPLHIAPPQQQHIIPQQQPQQQQQQQQRQQHVVPPQQHHIAPPHMASAQQHRIAPPQHIIPPQQQFQPNYPPQQTYQQFQIMQQQQFH
ncbi:uncharacterized protein EV154DRAFT_427717 [Mucor mucedo]|uniref:uncharacterized protein n=1 Tax=Mucor mucedo TaxID=29922 RepID=UPI00221F2AE2|nr:uncharacterized protein EV154DRAFT_427717 [Mucor mucedo]KAI7885449.1 hypothetical protein EV154DRAFT_427717 [Mucor mucedo]